MKVYNLSNDVEVTFSDSVTAKYAVQYCAAQERLGIIFASLLWARNPTEIDRVFPVIIGKHSVSCGNWAVKEADQ